MKKFQNILCIRADNMGDLIMTSPAIRALKETFNCRITVLTSSAGKIIAPFIKEIDEVITADLPWVKTSEPVNIESYNHLKRLLQQKQFDLAVIFTVYSQNPLPAAMLALEASIPDTLAYCRENPYHLISIWEKEKEPYDLIKHQVKRDLDLVASIGAATKNDSLILEYNAEAQESLQLKLKKKNLNLFEPFVILHPGVSEEKRMYPFELWVEIAQKIAGENKIQLIITGSKGEQKLAEDLAKASGGVAVPLAGEINIEEMITLVDHARALISVNTGPVHIAAAVQTPVVVLYALTNPQHTPWKVPAVVLPFSVNEELKSNNQVVQFVNKKMAETFMPPPTPNEIVASLKEILTEKCSVYESVLRF